MRATVCFSTFEIFVVKTTSDNSQKVETIQMFTNWWLHKPNVVSPYSVIWFNKKLKEQTADNNMDESQKYRAKNKIMLGERHQTEKIIT